MSLFPASDIPVFWVTCRPALIYSVKIQIQNRTHQIISLWVVLLFSVCVYVTLCLWSHTLLQLPVHKSNSVTWSAFTHWCSYPDRVSDWLFLSSVLSLYALGTNSCSHHIVFTFTHLKISRGFESPPTLCVC